MHTSAEALVDRIIPVVRSRLPAGVTPAYFDGFVRRNRSALVAILDRQLAARSQRNRTGSSSRPGTSGDRYAEVYAQPPDLWAASQRTAANLAAMRLAAGKRPKEMTADCRATLAAHSGWGGLSIQAVAAQFQTGFPIPKEPEIVQEYCAPTKVAREVDERDQFVLDRDYCAEHPDHVLGTEMGKDTGEDDRTAKLTRAPAPSRVPEAGPGRESTGPPPTPPAPAQARTAGARTPLGPSGDGCGPRTTTGSAGWPSRS